MDIKEALIVVGTIGAGLLVCCFVVACLFLLGPAAL